MKKSFKTRLLIKKIQFSRYYYIQKVLKNVNYNSYLNDNKMHLLN